MKLIRSIAFLLLLSSLAFGQGGHVDLPAIFTQSSSPMQLPGITITICLASASGTPCSPAVSVFSDQALTAPIANLQSDGDGLFRFWITPGTYQWCASDPAQGRISPYCNPFSVGATNGSSPSFVNLTVTQSLFVNGNIFATGTCAAPPYSFQTQSNAGLCLAGVGTVALSAGGVAQLSATSTGVSIPGNLGVTGAATFGSENGIQIVGNGTNTNIAAAITAAGTTGAVMIPPGYVGADAINNTSNVAMLDYRRNNSAIGIWSVLQPAFPTTSFALGNDLALHAAGPADIHLRNRDLQVTSSTSTVAATPVTVTVASPTLYGVAASGNPTALFSTNAGIILEPGTTNQETVATFTIASGTTLAFTPANNHTQPFKIRQQGIIFLDGYGLKPSADPTAQNNFFDISDGNGNKVIRLPIQNGAFPLNAPQFPAVMTGANGANSNILWRQNNAASQFLLVNSANTFNLVSIDDSGNDIRNGTGGQLTFKNSGTPVATLQNAAGTGLLTLDVIRLNGTPASAGNIRLNTASTIGFRNNGNTADVSIAKDTSDRLTWNGGIVTSGVGSTSQKAESAADTNVLTVTPPAVAGTYRLNFVLDVSAATAATLGWTATWKDSNGNAQAPTNLSLEQSGIAAPALTFVLAASGVLYGFAVINIDASATNIVIKLTFTGTSFAAKASATIERLI